MKVFNGFVSPQIEKIHKGKVRDSYKLSGGRRLISVTDRISAFDSVLKTPVPYKGAILNRLSNFWFEQTKDIISNHFIEEIDPCITMVKELVPIKIEMIVRGYLTGSMWRYYQEGKREFSGLKVPDGLKKNQKFPEPILTPTTKEESDREITPDEIISSGLADKKTYEKLTQTALKLYKYGSELLLKKGIVLVDTKYEFGLDGDRVILMDEIHTPDSSRFWRLDDYQKHPDNAEQIDKEFVRQWLISNKKDGQYPDSLPEDVIKETTKRYFEIYKLITGEEFTIDFETDPEERVYGNLLKSEIIKEGFIALVMGSPGDMGHANKIAEYLKPFPVYIETRIVSAHKNGERLPALSEEYNESIEPGAVIAIAGRSNGLGGALASNLNIPVINCPPFKDNCDIMLNINSSLMMPSQTPAMTVIHPDNAAYAALRCLNLKSIKKQFSSLIMEQKAKLLKADKESRGR